MSLASCSGGSTSSGGGQEHTETVLSLTQTDKEAFAMIPGGFQGKYLKGSTEIQRWDIPIGGAYPDGLIVLGNDTLNQPVTWVANVIFHEACHHRGAGEQGPLCSREEEKRCIRENIEFDKTIGGNHIEHLKNQIEVHTCS